MQTHNVSRRTILSGSIAVAAGLPFLNTTSFAAIQLPAGTQVPLMPNSVTTGMKAVSALVVSHAKARTLTRAHIGAFSGAATLLFGLAEENGTLAILQKSFTQESIDSFEWGQAQNQKLAAIVIGSEEADYNQAQNAFTLNRGLFKPDLSKNVATLLANLQNLELPVVASIVSPRFKRATFCWYGIYSAFAGFFAALTFELPPIAVAFGTMAFVYGVLAGVYC